MLQSDRAEFELAQKRFEEIAGEYQKAKATGVPWQENDAYKALAHAVEPGIYEHFKSGEDTPKIYLVFGVSFQVEEGVPWIVYAALYSAQKCTLTLRPLLDTKDAFLLPIDRPEYVGKRFRLLRTAPLEELGKISDTFQNISFSKRSEFADTLAI